ncbi:MAG: CHRD domain-containing protein [Nitrososphaeraceae archaeon]
MNRFSYCNEQRRNIRNIHTEQNPNGEIRGQITSSQ